MQNLGKLDYGSSKYAHARVQHNRSRVTGLWDHKGLESKDVISRMHYYVKELLLISNHTLLFPMKWQCLSLHSWLVKVCELTWALPWVWQVRVTMSDMCLWSQFKFPGLSCFIFFIDWYINTSDSHHNSIELQFSYWA